MDAAKLTLVDAAKIPTNVQKQELHGVHSFIKLEFIVKVNTQR